MISTYSAIEKNFGKKDMDSDSQVFQLCPGINEIVEINNNLPSFITVTVDEIRLEQSSS